MSTEQIERSNSRRKGAVPTLQTPNASEEVLAEAKDGQHWELSELSKAGNSSTEAILEDTANHIHGLPLALTLVALSSAVFCVALDMTIIATAIPRITDEFHALQDVGWYGSAYLLTTCGEFEHTNASLVHTDLVTCQLSNSPSAKSTAYSTPNGCSCGHYFCSKSALRYVAPRLRHWS
jgi:hypothetical protein